MMGHRRVAPRRDENEEAPEFWVAYSDLLVSLLMVFALLLFLALSSIQRGVRVAADHEDAVNQALDKGRETLEGTGTVVRLDSATNTLALDAEVLFAYGSSRLRPQAAQAIHDITTRFIPEVLRNPAVDTMLHEIAIIGHTDTVGSYMSNLQLSQDRAYSVMQAMVYAADDKQASRLRKLLVASGRSKMEPVYLEGAISDSLSRRIEIQFRTRNDLLLKQIFEQTRGEARR
jgi:chemotaxis protein MotB